MISTRPTIPADRYRERLAAARDLAGEAGFAAILVGVGADMRYLAGYPAMPLERLTMLVIPAAGDWPLVAPRLEATPARSCPPAAAGTAAGRRPGTRATTPHALVARMVRDANGGSRDGGSGRGLGRPAGPAPAPPPGAPRRAPGSSSPRRSWADSRIVKDADEIALLTEAAHAADRVVAQIAARPAGRPDRGGRRARGPRATHRRRPRRGRISRSSAPGRTPRRRTTRRPSGSSAPASRSCSTSAARSAATARTSRGRCG